MHAVSDVVAVWTLWPTCTCTDRPLATVPARTVSDITDLLGLCRHCPGAEQSRAERKGTIHERREEGAIKCKNNMPRWCDMLVRNAHVAGLTSLMT